MMNKRKVGTDQETLAANYLKRQGVRILERNFRSRRGEIDLIGRDQEYLVFIEVKYRSSAAQGYPEEAVSYSKQKNICRTANYYRCIRHVPMKTAIRYDVIAIEGEQIRWVKNAFPHHD